MGVILNKHVVYVIGTDPFLFLPLTMEINFWHRHTSIVEKIHER